MATAVTLNPERILATLINDPGVERRIPHPKSREMLRALVFHLPTLLAELLPQRVTFTTFFRTQHTIATHVVNTQMFIEVIPVHFPISHLRDRDLDGLAIPVFSPDVLSLFELILSNPSYLNDDRQIIETLSFNNASAQEHRAGTLTIARLLTVQPNTILNIF